MKNLSLVLNVVLLVAVAVLFYLHFSGGRSVAADGTPTVLAGSSRTNMAVAYVNTDSLLRNYDFYKDVESELELSRQKYTKEFENRARGLETEIKTFQQTAGNMTMVQAKATEEQLMRKQNNLMQYEQNLTQRLMQEQGRYLDSLDTVVRSFVKEYGEQNNLDVVLNYQKGSGVIFAKDSLDITNEVIAGLNERYRAKKPKAEVKEEAKTKK